MSRRLIFVFLLVLLPVIALADGFTIKPFVTNVTPTSIDVCFTSDVQDTAVIRFGRTEEMLRQKAVTGRRFEAAWGEYKLYGFFSFYDVIDRYDYCRRLDGLHPDSLYFYQVEVGDAVGDVHSFFTAPDEPAPFSFIVYGDSRSDPLYPLGVPNRFHEEVIELMVEQPVDLLLHTGDFVNDGFDMHLWEIALDIVNPVSSEIPLYIAFGNHEDRDHVGVDGRDVFGSLLSHPGDASGSGSEEYFSFDYANAHFCFVSTEDGFNIDPDDPQVEWIRADLDAANADPDIDWVFMLYHIPGLTSSFRYQNDGKEQEAREFLVPLAEEYGVDFVFAGHEHSYERSRRDSGLMYIVTGNGGALPTFVGFPSNNPWSQVFEANADFKHFGFVRVDIAGDYLVLTSLISDGTVIDVYEIGQAPVDDDTGDDDTVTDDDAIDDDDVSDDDVADDDVSDDDDQAPANDDEASDEDDDRGCGC